MEVHQQFVWVVVVDSEFSDRFGFSLAGQANNFSLLKTEEEEEKLLSVDHGPINEVGPG